MRLAKELEQLRNLVKRLDKELGAKLAAAAPENATTLAGAMPSAPNYAGWDCIKDRLHRLDAQSDRADTQFDGLDRRLTQMTARIDGLETRLAQRSHLLEVQVQNLRENLPAVIEESIREGMRTEQK